MSTTTPIYYSKAVYMQFISYVCRQGRSIPSKMLLGLKMELCQCTATISNERRFLKTYHTGRAGRSSCQTNYLSLRDPTEYLRPGSLRSSTGTPYRKWLSRVRLWRARERISCLPIIHGECGPPYLAFGCLSHAAYDAQWKERQLAFCPGRHHTS